MSKFCPIINEKVLYTECLECPEKICKGEIRMPAKKNILIVIDLQKQFADRTGEYERCLEFIEENKNKYDKIIGTVFSQNSENKYNPNYSKHFQWDDCLNCSENDLEYVTENVKVIKKTGYGSIELIDFLTKNYSKTDNIEIIGCDLDACVAAICFQLWDEGFENFKVLTNFCYSTSKFPKQDLVKVLRRNFGNCII